MQNQILFLQLHVDLPFSVVLEKMPQYAKFMKEILSKKRRLSEIDGVIAMTEEPSAIIQKKADRISASVQILPDNKYRSTRIVRLFKLISNLRVKKQIKTS